MPKKEITWISGNDWVAMQTEAIKQNFGSSRPRPRPRKMGLRPEPRKKPVGYEKLGLTIL